MRTQCQVHKDCPRPPQTLLITSCIEQHLTETITCRTHLGVLAKLDRENKLYCHCGKHIITAMYKYRNTVKNLNDQEDPWPNPTKTG